MAETITEFDIGVIKEELLNRFRDGFNIIDILERIDVVSMTYSPEQFIKIDNKRLSFIREIVSGTTTYRYGKDYIVHWYGDKKGYVEILTTLPIDDFVITWGRIKIDKSNFVHSDFPRIDLGVHSYPRIGFKTFFNKNVAGLGGCKNIQNVEILIQIKIIGNNTREIDNITTFIDKWISQHAKSFYNFNWIQARNIGEFDDFNDNTETIHSKIIEYTIPRKLQVENYK